MEGGWCFSPEAVKAFAPSKMLTRGEFSSGEIWEAELQDLFHELWAFSPVCENYVPPKGTYE
jgi:hypothetical protein